LATTRAILWCSFRRITRPRRQIDPIDTDADSGLGPPGAGEGKSSRNCRDPPTCSRTDHPAELAFALAVSRACRTELDIARNRLAPVVGFCRNAFPIPLLVRTMRTRTPHDPLPAIANPAGSPERAHAASDRPDGILTFVSSMPGRCRNRIGLQPASPFNLPRTNGGLPQRSEHGGPRCCRRTRFRPAEPVTPNYGSSRSRRAGGLEESASSGPHRGGRAGSYPRGQ